MGIAYLASHPVLKRPFVIKTFRSVVGEDLFQEAHLAARVSSPYVVGVADAGIEEGIAFVIQHYVDGIDLSELVKAHRSFKRPMPSQVVVRVIIDAARGLHAIHQAGVVHRDVKPANLFLSGSGHATVGDFGIAISDDPDQSGGVIVGTPDYMAPEQWEGQVIDRRTDLYALGATGHLLSTNRRPFHAKSMAEYALVHKHQVYTPPEAHSPREAYLFSAFERMMQKSPADRYESADAVARELEVIATEVTIHKRGHSEVQIGALTVRVIRGDLATCEAGVLVNAANSELLMDLGVASSLKAVGGQEIEDEAAAQGPVTMGTVVWTSAGGLKAGAVAHAVAAMNGAVCIQRCVLRVLLGAELRNYATVMMPALGTGMGQVPMALAAKLTLEAIRTFASFEPWELKTITVVLFDGRALETWRRVLRSM